MLNLVNRRVLLAGASLLAAATGARAQTPPNTLYGGGDTLSAKVYRDIFNCYSSAAQGIYASSPGNPGNVTYPTAENALCTAPQNVDETFANEPVGGVALTAFTSGNPASFGSPSTTNTIAYLNSNVGVNSTPYPEIEFAGSVAYLSSTQASEAATITGAIFQVPTIASPIDLPVGQIQNVALTTADVCNIFSGSTATSAKGQTFSEVVVRSDSAGQAFVLGDFLAQNCPANLGFNSANGFPSNTPNWTAVFNANGNHLPLVPVSGAGGMASTVANTPGAIGFISPDYVYPVVPTSTAYPVTVNKISPVVSAKTVGTKSDEVAVRLTKLKYPAKYVAATIGQQINDSLVAPGGKGYPIVGFAFIDTYSCYSASFDGGKIGTPAKGTALKAAIEYLYTAGVTPLIGSQGFDPAPAKLIKLLKSATGPFGASGIQNKKCPKT